MSFNTRGDSRIFTTTVYGQVFGGGGFERLEYTDKNGINRKKEITTIFSIGIGPVAYEISDEKDFNTRTTERSHGITFGAKMGLGLGVQAEGYCKFGGFDNTEPGDFDESDAEVEEPEITQTQE